MMTEEWESQTAEVIQFASSHRNELKPVEQWLNSIDNIVDAWLLAVNESPRRDWHKIIYLEWLFRDEKLYQHEIILDEFDVRQWCESDKQQSSANFERLKQYGEWRTEQHPVYYIVQAAILEAKKAIEGEIPLQLPEINLSDKDITILQEFTRIPAASLLAKEIERVTGINRNTVKDRITKRLVPLGFLGKSDGRDGFHITDKGIAYDKKYLS